MHTETANLSGVRSSIAIENGSSTRSSALTKIPSCALEGETRFRRNHQVKTVSVSVGVSLPPAVSAGHPGRLVIVAPVEVVVVPALRQQVQPTLASERQKLRGQHRGNAVKYREKPQRLHCKNAAQGRDLWPYVRSLCEIHGPSQPFERKAKGSVLAAKAVGTQRQCLSRDRSGEHTRRWAMGSVQNGHTFGAAPPSCFLTSSVVASISARSSASARWLWRAHNPR